MISNRDRLRRTRDGRYEVGVYIERDKYARFVAKVLVAYDRGGYYLDEPWKHICDGNFHLSDAGLRGADDKRRPRRCTRCDAGATQPRLAFQIQRLVPIRPGIAEM